MKASEIPEAEATGETAVIYGELRYFYGAAYVSSMQRLLAAWPGALEWAWAAVRPGFASGQIPETAWRLAAPGDLPHLPPLSASALRVLGVDAAAEAEIRDVCGNFAHVSPVNLLFGGCLRRLLRGESAGGAPSASLDWTPPAALSPLPDMVTDADMDDDQRAVLAQFTARLGEASFVPGLYRMLARYPAYLAHVATVLGPLFVDAKVSRICDQIRDQIDAAAPDILAQLPPCDLPPPPPDVAAEVLAAIESYRNTSPQMIVFSTLLRNSLPAARVQ